MNGTGMNKFKSIKVANRADRDWQIRAFRNKFFNDPVKSEDKGEFNVEVFDEENICLSSSNGFESLKFKVKNEQYLSPP